jgi:hypothetical protein
MEKMVKFGFVDPLRSSSHSVVDEILDITLKPELIFIHVVNFGNEDIRD